MTDFNQQKNKIIELYTLYNFQQEKILKDILIFSYNQGYFNNVEIVYIKKTKELTSLENEYKNCGYAVNLKEYISIDDIHNNLFKGFFKPEVQRRRLTNQYSKFEETRNNALFNDCKYSYIPCSYVLNTKSYEDDSLINFLSEKVTENKSSITFLEAAAGFGKTCTTYELMKNLLSSNFTNYIPLFIELSKNRSAKVFRYVLLDEIDVNFGGMESDIVIEEIKNGRIPLIIDGFDELLSESNLDEEIKNYDSEKNQTMINTILELFSKDSKTKIIITSRKTALRMGNVIDSVLERLIYNNEVNQITLVEPNIKKWIGKEKIELLNTLSFPINNFINPIILSYLQTIDINKLHSTDFSYEKLVNDYIDRIFNRERERQSLIFTPNEQKNIFTLLASYFISFHITSEEPNFIYELLKDILKDNFNLKEIISQYINYEEKPTEKQIITKLSHHALLDTNASQKQYIGFLNDFVSGLFMGYVLLDDKLQEEKVTLNEIEIDKICSAYFPMEQNTKDKLYKKIKEKVNINENEINLHLDYILLNHLSQNYTEINVTSETFINFDFSNYSISDSFFSNCTFSNCNISTITNSQFFNCNFYSTGLTTSIDKDKQNIFIQCDGIIITEKEKIPINSSKDYKKLVLEQFWQKGRDHAELRRWPKTLYRGFERCDYDSVNLAIEGLTKDKILLWTDLCYLLNLEKINEIKKILGR